MTAFCSHQDRVHELAGVSRSLGMCSSRQIYANWLSALVRGAIVRTSAGLRIVQRAIAGASDDWSFEPTAYRNRDPDSDMARFPQRPLILGDKWDF